MAGSAAAVKIARELKSMAQEPVEGILCEVIDDSNIFEWTIYIEGSKGSPYEGGVFQAQMSFPNDYPMSPPKLKMLSEFFHPNVYTDGRFCISILHDPVHDPFNPKEDMSEKWLPTQTVSTIMLSILSMLNDPNINSPANVDASVCWRDNRKVYLERCKKLAEKSLTTLKPGVKDRIPHPDTDPAQREKAIQKMKLLNEPMMTLDEGDYGDAYDYGDDFSFGDDDYSGDFDDEESYPSDMSAEETGDYGSD